MDAFIYDACVKRPLICFFFHIMLASHESFSCNLLLQTINIQQLQLTCIQNITADLGGVSLALIVGLTVNKVFAGSIVGQGLCSKF